jgi:Tol biopolymer transport system component
MFAPEIGARAALMVAKPDGTSPRTVVSNAEDNFGPVFVPHSDRILFLRSGAFEHYYSPLVDNHRHKIDLFSADLATGSVTQITKRKFYDCRHISVSADGKQTIISSSFNFLILSADEPDPPIRSLQPGVPNAPSQPVDYYPTWLPDGRSIIFSAAVQPPSGNYDYNVYRLDIDSGAIEQLTNLSGPIEGLSVSTDGKKAVLLRQGTYLILNLSTHQLRPM